MLLRVVSPVVAAICLSAGAPSLAQAAPRPVDVVQPCLPGLLSCYTAPTPAVPAAPAVPAPPAPARPAAQAPALPCPGQDRMPTAAGIDEAETATLCLVNRQRRFHRLVALKPVAPLSNVAGAYARRMTRENFFDHVSPGGSTFVARIKRTNYLDAPVRTWSVGENLAWGTGRLATPQAIVASWMRSPAHRQNILAPGFRELGLGVSVGAPQSGITDGRAATYVNEFGQRRR